MRGRHFGRAGLVAATALALDQASKAAVRSTIDSGESVSLPAGVDLVRVANEGIAFGLFSDLPGAVIVIGAAAFTVLLGLFLAAGSHPGAWLPIGLIGGGALGNLLDRIVHGAVTDFIDPPRWPAFNLADVEITVGVALLVVLMLRDRPREGPGSRGP